MNRTIRISVLCSLMLALTGAVQAQNNYKMTFSSPSLADGKHYIGQHFRNTFIVKDSAEAKSGSVVFAGKRKLDTGVYTLLDDKKQKIFDFMVDDSRTFSTAFDEK